MRKGDGVGRCGFEDRLAVIPGYFSLWLYDFLQGLGRELNARRDYPNHIAKNSHPRRPQLLGSEQRCPIWLMTVVHRLSRTESKLDSVFISGASQHRSDDANNSLSTFVNFKLALRTNEYALYVKLAGLALAPLQRCSADRFFLFLFLLLHILPRTRGNQFPCNSVQDMRTYWDTKQASQTTKFHLVLVWEVFELTTYLYVYS